MSQAIEIKRAPPENRPAGIEADDDATSAAQALAATVPRVAVVVPCHNEATAVARVCRDFARALPHATIYVYDNASTDLTSDVAAAEGAIVRREPLRGKGNVVRRMFADVEADIYVLVDGDATYDADSAPRMIELLRTQTLDMVCGARVSQDHKAYRPGHRFGNALLTSMVTRIFGDRVQDLLSGFRVLSRRFVKSFPALARGFEIETELTVHALELRMPIAEIPTPYGSRPEGSTSKLNTIRDGIRILLTIISLVKEERPFPFFGFIALVFACASLTLAYPVFIQYFATHTVPRLPTAVASTAAMLVSFLSLSCGVILDSVTRARRELKRMHYLSVPPPR